MDNIVRKKLSIVLGVQIYITILGVIDWFVDINGTYKNFIFFWIFNVVVVTSYVAWKYTKNYLYWSILFVLYNTVFYLILFPLQVLPFPSPSGFIRMDLSRLTPIIASIFFSIVQATICLVVWLVKNSFSKRESE